MQETYKMFSQIRVAKYAGLTNEELALAYQKENLKPEILAEMYCRNISILKHFADRFYSIDNCDKVSIIVEELNRTMQKYDESYGKYITLAFHSIQEKFIALLNYNNRKGRIDLFTCDRFENYLDNQNYDSDDNYITYNEFDNDFEESELGYSIDKSNNLTAIEKAVCKLFMSSANYTREDIAIELGISRQSVQNAIKNLKSKLQLVLN